MQENDKKIKQKFKRQSVMLSKESTKIKIKY